MNQLEFSVFTKELYETIAYSQRYGRAIRNIWYIFFFVLLLRLQVILSSYKQRQLVIKPS